MQTSTSPLVPTFTTFYLILKYLSIHIKIILTRNNSIFTFPIVIGNAAITDKTQTINIILFVRFPVQTYLVFSG